MARHRRRLAITQLRAADTERMIVLRSARAVRELEAALSSTAQPGTVLRGLEEELAEVEAA